MWQAQRTHDVRWLEFSTHFPTWSLSKDLRMWQDTAADLRRRPLIFGRLGQLDSVSRQSSALFLARSLVFAEAIILVTNHFKSLDWFFMDLHVPGLLSVSH